MDQRGRESEIGVRWVESLENHGETEAGLGSKAARSHWEDVTWIQLCHEQNTRPLTPLR